MNLHISTFNNHNSYGVDTLHIYTYASVEKVRYTLLSRYCKIMFKLGQGKRNVDLQWFSHSAVFVLKYFKNVVSHSADTVL